MRNLARRHKKSGIAIAVIFVVQMLATGFCATANAHAASGLSHDAMQMQCPMDMPASAKHGTTHCAHCHPPAFNPAADQADHVATTWMPIAILTPMADRNLAATEHDRPVDFTRSHAPPRSSSLIFGVNQRIRI